MYPHQIERLTEALKEAELGALMATSAANVAYVTGFRGLEDAGSRATAWALFTPRGTALVVPAADAVRAILDGADVDHVVAFGEACTSFGPGRDPAVRRLRTVMEERRADAAEAVRMAVETLGVRGTTIGVDASGLSHEEWERVSDCLAGHKLVNGGVSLRGARRVKGPFEIACLERALRAAEEALNEVIQTLARGTTEREAAAAYRAEVVKRGAEPGRVLVAVGERSAIPLACPTERALRPGELIRFDVGCVHHGYQASVARTAVLGEPTAEHDALHGAIQAGVEAGIERVRPGRAAGTVWAAAMEAAREHGLAEVHRAPVGHGIGLEARELPALSPDDPTPIEAGEVLQIAMAHHQIDAFGCAITDTVLVTMGGARVLNRSARGLVTLD